jgi:hypothetical protein
VNDSVQDSRGQCGVSDDLLENKGGEAHPNTRSGLSEQPVNRPSMSSYIYSRRDHGPGRCFPEQYWTRSFVEPYINQS